MIYIQVNYVAVVLAAIANMVVGFLWFGPIFGKQWIKMMGWTEQEIQKAQKKGMTKSYIVAIIGSLLTAWIIAEISVMVSSYLGLSGVMAGLKTGFIGWIGFVVTVLLSTVAWEGKSWNLWLLNAGYYLLAFLVMGVIVGVM